MNRHFLIAACVLLSSSCATTSGLGPARQVAGVYRQGFEVESFRPCRSREQWWVVGGGELNTLYRQAATEPYQDVYVVVRGQLSRKGRFGHLGRYSRQFLIEEVIQVQPGGKARC